MRSETHLIVRRGRCEAVHYSVLVLLLGVGVMPLGVSQQDQGQNQAAPASSAPAQGAPAQPQQAVAAPTEVPAADNTKDQRMIAENAALLKLATELKAAVDKSTKDTLSLAVIRKADAIEHMAHGMKDRYRASAARN
jgi:hypothetical protein